MRALARFWRDGRGASAVEMAMILPALMFLMLGAGNLLALTYATVSLHAATEAAARYASVTTAATGASPTQTAVSSYATSIYKGPGVGQSFTYADTGTCGTSGSNGNQVTASGSYNLYYGLGRIPVSINTQACYP